MRALCCMACSTVTTPPHTGEWRFCDCLTAAMRWTDPSLDEAEVWTSYPQYTWVLDLDNMMLTLQPDQVKHAGHGCRAAGWRQVHDAAVDVSPLGSLFRQYGCWAVLFKPGETDDVKLVLERPEVAGG